MSVQISTASNFADLLNQLDTFLTSTGMALTPIYTATGNGAISAKGGSASVAELITITFTSATAFGVVGSVSGSLGTGTVGTPFTSTKANFTISPGGTAFVNGDVIAFSVAPPWTSLRRSSGSEMIWQAPGNGGVDQIIVGARCFSNVGGDYYNWRLGGFTAFNSGQTFQQQVGYVGGLNQANPSPVMQLWNSTIPYWFIANGRRVIVIAKISGVYSSCYLGFMNTYIAPGTFPYPLVVGGSIAWNDGAEPSETGGDSRWRWSYTGAETSVWAKGYLGGLTSDRTSTLRLRLPNGEWRGFSGSWNEASFGKLFPMAAANYNSYDLRSNLDGSYSLLPVVLWDVSPQANQYGELDGVFDVTGFGNGAENTVTINGVAHLVVQNLFRNGRADYYAVRLS